MFPTFKHQPKQEFKPYRCTVCGYIYDEKKGCPENEIAPHTHLSDLPWDWECPECEAGKESFEPK